MKCAAYTNKGAPCKNDGTKVREVADKSYMVCGPHFDQVNVRVNESMARGEEKPVDASQVNLILPGTIEAAREQLKLVDFPTTGIDIQTVDYTDMLDEYTQKYWDDKEKEVVVEPIRIMVTGHTVISNEALLEERLTLIMNDYINRWGINNIIAVSGGALGADRLWARVAHKLGVPFEIYVPTGYENIFIGLRRWNAKSDAMRQRDLDRFKRMLEAASAVYDEYGRPREQDIYHRGSNFIRNGTMVRVSQHCVAVSKEDPRTVVTHRQPSGTFDAIRKWYRAGNDRINWVETPQCNVYLNYSIGGEA